MVQSRSNVMTADHSQRHLAWRSVPTVWLNVSWNCHWNVHCSHSISLHPQTIAKNLHTWNRVQKSSNAASRKQSQGCNLRSVRSEFSNTMLLGVTDTSWCSILMPVSLFWFAWYDTLADTLAVTLKSHTTHHSAVHLSQVKRS